MPVRDRKTDRDIELILSEVKRLRGIIQFLEYMLEELSDHRKNIEAHNSKTKYVL